MSRELPQQNLPNIVPNLTVAQLKQCVRDIRAQFGYCMTIGGNKPDLVNKLLAYIAQNPTRLETIRQIVLANYSNAGWTLTNPAAVKAKTSYATPSSSSPKQTSTASAPRPVLTLTEWLKFRPNPFFEIVSPVTSATICGEVYNHRNSVKFDFFLNSTQTSLLEPFGSDGPSSSVQHQLLFFCTTIPTSYHQYPPPHGGSLMEFPNICEIKVNGKPMELNLRGIKRRPGSVYPPNITPLCTKGVINKVDFTYQHTHVKYVACVYLCRRKSISDLIKEVKEKRYLSKELVLERFQKNSKDKDDIVATQSSLSLKDPIAFHRINVPCRSSLCSHAQCFDARTFLSMNEQTPTWTCPLCNRALKSWDEVIVDGYFESILNSVPPDVDAVVLEPNWAWRLPDASGNTPHKKETSQRRTIVNLDDDDDDAGTLPGRAAPESRKRLRSFSPSTPVPNKRVAVAHNVIDLTLDSSDEDELGIDALIVASSADANLPMNDQTKQIKNEAVPAAEAVVPAVTSNGCEPVNGHQPLPSTPVFPAVSGTPDLSTRQEANPTSTPPPLPQDASLHGPATPALSPSYPRLPLLPILPDASEAFPFAISTAGATPSIPTNARAGPYYAYSR